LAQVRAGMSSMLSRSGVTSPVEYVVSLELEVEQLAHATLIGLAPPVVVDYGSEVVISEHRRASSLGYRLDNQGSVAEPPADSPDPIADLFIMDRHVARPHDTNRRVGLGGECRRHRRPAGGQVSHQLAAQSARFLGSGPVIVWKQLSPSPDC
jgi:hypothetical protein